MKLTNSYIFLKKEEEMSKDKNGNYVIVLKDSIPTIFQQMFNAEEDDLLLGELEEDSDKTSEKLKDLFYKIRRGKFVIKLDDNTDYEVNYKFTCVNSSYYLDIIINEKEKNGILVLERINEILLDSVNDINKDYIIIKSYDGVSEYYCNLIYPKLNRFERKLRKLLYLIYTGRFEKEYFKKTTPEVLQSSIKGKIKSKENNKKKKELDYAKVFFESFDFGELQNLLFEKRWTELEDIEINNFLKDNKDLSSLSDKELRDFILSMKPKSDWERFFKNKGLSEDIAEIIKEIGTLRNNVAHNKNFSKEQYSTLKDLLDKTEKEIDEAITITETEDFIKINEEKIKRTLKNFSNSMKEMFSSITNAIMPSIQKQTESMKEITNKLKDIALSIYEKNDDDN